MNNVFIGRFQLPHMAHLKIIRDSLERSDDRILIIIGSRNSPRTPRNPWKYEERVAMLRNAIADEFGVGPGWTDKPHEVFSRISFAPARDYLYNDYKWVSEIQSTADRHFQGGKITLRGCYKDDTSYYLNMFPSWKLEASPFLWKLSAETLRSEMFSSGADSIVGSKYLHASTKKAMQSWYMSEHGLYVRDEYRYYEDYKKPYIGLPYSVSFQTADAVVIKSGCVLLVRRKNSPGKGLMALPGGFLKEDKTLEQTMIDELKEETGLDVPKPVIQRSVVSSKRFDHPRRSLRGRVVTDAFLVDLGKSGPLPAVNPKGGDDADRAMWVPLADFFTLEEEMFEDHWSIVYSMIANY